MSAPSSASCHLICSFSFAITDFPKGLSETTTLWDETIPNDGELGPSGWQINSGDKLPQGTSAVLAANANLLEALAWGFLLPIAPIRDGTKGPFAPHGDPAVTQ